jgi:hypothetical protein
VDTVHRWDHSSSYPRVASDVARLLGSSKFQRPVAMRGGGVDTVWAGRTLAVDRGGVGLPLVQYLQRQIPEGVELRAIYVHHGHSVTEPQPGFVNLPKRDLIGAAVSAFQIGQLKIMRGVQFAKELESELKSFRREISPSGRDTYKGGGPAHDDLVFSLALSVWSAGAGDGGRIEWAGPEILAAFDWV